MEWKMCKVHGQYLRTCNVVQKETNALWIWSCPKSDPKVIVDFIKPLYIWFRTIATNFNLGNRANEKIIFFTVIIV